MEGEVAKDLTSAEFLDIIKDLKAELSKRSNRKKLARGERWMLSIDNDSRHTAAHLQARGCGWTRTGWPCHRSAQT